MTQNQIITDISYYYYYYMIYIAPISRIELEVITTQHFQYFEFQQFFMALINVTDGNCECACICHMLCRGTESESDSHQ